MLWGIVESLGTIPVYFDFHTPVKLRIVGNAILVAGGVLLFFLTSGQFVQQGVALRFRHFEIQAG
jgi:small neutral amino acid transporter SnatA (MarC family)